MAYLDRINERLDAGERPDPHDWLQFIEDQALDLAKATWTDENGGDRDIEYSGYEFMRPERVGEVFREIRLAMSRGDATAVMERLGEVTLDAIKVAEIDVSGRDFIARMRHEDRSLGGKTKARKRGYSYDEIRRAYEGCVNHGMTKQQAKVEVAQRVGVTVRTVERALGDTA